MTTLHLGACYYPARFRHLVRILVESAVDAVRLTVWCQVLGVMAWAGFDWPAVQDFALWVWHAEQALIQSALVLQLVWVCTLTLWMAGRRLEGPVFRRPRQEVSIP